MASAATTLVTPLAFFCWSAERFAESMMAVMTTSSSASAPVGAVGAGACCASAPIGASRAATMAVRQAAWTPELMDMMTSDGPSTDRSP